MFVEKQKQEKEQKWVEDTKYHDSIPDEIIGEMPLEIIEQYYLWDEVVKKEVQRYPWLLTPLIREVFHRSYLKNAKIRLIATEYVVRRIHKADGSTLSSIFADIAVQIENEDIYHLECQMNKDKEIVLRMLEYDIHIGMTHGIGNFQEDGSEEESYEIKMPRSVILYLNHLDNMPSEETCFIKFADGIIHKYKIPVMKVQSYTTKMIEEKHLNMLIPFLPIRFRKYLNKRSDVIKNSIMETVRKDLTELIRECIMIIDREKRNGTLTEMAGRDIIDFLSITCSYLLKNEPELGKEVQGIMKPIVMLQSERAEKAEKELEDMRPIIQLQSERAEKAEKAIRLQSERAEKAEKELEDMKPIVMLQSERAEKAEKELEDMRLLHRLQSERAEKAEKELEEMRLILRLQSERAEKAEKAIQLQSERPEKAEKELEDMRPIIQLQSERAEKAEKELEQANEKVAAIIKKFIEKAILSGQKKQEIQKDIQEIFSLNEREAEEQLREYQGE